MDGRSALALKTSRKVLPNAGDFAQEVPPAIEPSLVILYDALVRFGRWDDLVAEPPPPVFMPVARVLWHHSRAVALAALGRVSEARAEQRVFRRAAADVPADRMMAINPAHRVFDIADKMLDGEILWREGDTDGAVARLREGIALEDQLAYMEPPEWPLPLRHALGAILLAAGRLDEAETAYREDLVNWPENGWSLHGLADCLHRRGAAEAAEMDTRFSKAWAQADIQIGSSCLCVATR